MRYAVLADIHGNLPALEATVASVRRNGVDGYLVAGDLVGYGPFPNECVELVAELDPICVAGNHDLIALGRLSDERCIPLARTTLQWTATVLTPRARNYLESLPLRASVPDGLVVTHGSLDRIDEYVTQPRRAVEQLEELRREQPAARLLIVGNTHRRWACDDHGRVVKLDRTATLSIGQDDRYVLNPGSVGQSREFSIRAQWMLVDAAQGTATFHALRYDVGRCKRELRRQGLPARTYHLPPSLVGRGRDAVTRTLRRR